MKKRDWYTGWKDEKMKKRNWYTGWKDEKMKKRKDEKMKKRKDEKPAPFHMTSFHQKLQSPKLE